MKKELNSNGYHVVEKIINTCEYGNIPQNRERLFIIGFLDEKVKNRFEWPEKIPLTNTIENIIDWNGKSIGQKYFYTNKMKCYNLLDENMTSSHSIYQFRRVYVRENKSGVCPTLTANMGTGGHNVPLIRDDKNNIRKLTPRECLLLQGFPKEFIIPEELTDSKVYKQAGNSVSVNVIKRIASQILVALNEQKN
jgi:DNA (cytosine-5)-methyltransferase 1